jgi:hypothetical protein
VTLLAMLKRRAIIRGGSPASSPVAARSLPCIVPDHGQPGVLAQEPGQRSVVRRLVRRTRHALPEWSQCLGGFAPQLIQLFGRQPRARLREQLVVENTEVSNERRARWPTGTPRGLTMRVHLEHGGRERRLHLLIASRIATQERQTVGDALEVGGKARSAVGTLCECLGRD